LNQVDREIKRASRGTSVQETITEGRKKNRGSAEKVIGRKTKGTPCRLAKGEEGGEEPPRGPGERLGKRTGNGRST